MEIVLIVVLLGICVGLSAYFSGTEIALLTLNKITVKRLKEEHKRRGGWLEKLFKNPSRWLITILIGNNLANIGAATLATLLVSKLFPTGAIGITLGVVTGTMTLIILIFGEITPKKYCQQRGPDIALKRAGTILFLSVIFRPLEKVLSLLTGGILKTLRVKEPKKYPVTEKDIHALIDIGQEEGALEEREEELVHSALEFDDTKVKEIMTPRTQMVSIEEEASLEDLRDLIKTSDFSRIPVYREKIDNIVGVVHIKDLLEADETKHTVKKIKHDPIFVPYTARLSEVFKKLKEKRIHLAIVVDEYGGVMGIVTMEDLVEEIFGEIEDEYDHSGEEIKIQEDGSAIVKAEVDIDRINEELGISLPEKSKEFDSIGGFVIHHFSSRIPRSGEVIKYDGVRIEILESDRKSVKRVKITKEKEESGEKV